MAVVSVVGMCICSHVRLLACTANCTTTLVVVVAVYLTCAAPNCVEHIGLSVVMSLLVWLAL